MTRAMTDKNVIPFRRKDEGRRWICPCNKCVAWREEQRRAG